MAALAETVYKKRQPQVFDVSILGISMGGGFNLGMIFLSTK